MRSGRTKPLFDFLENFQVYYPNGSTLFVGPYSYLDPVANPCFGVGFARANPWLRAIDRRSHVHYEGLFIGSRLGKPDPVLGKWFIENPWNIFYYTGWFPNGSPSVAANYRRSKFHRRDPFSPPYPPGFKKENKEHWDFLSFNWYWLKPDQKQELIDAWLLSQKEKSALDFARSPWYLKLFVSIPDFLRDLNLLLNPLSQFISNWSHARAYALANAIIFSMDFFIFVFKDWVVGTSLLDAHPLFLQPLRFPEIVYYTYFMWFSFLFFPFGVFVVLVKRYVDGPNSSDWTLPRHRHYVINEILMEVSEAPSERFAYWRRKDGVYRKNIAYILGTAEPWEFYQWGVDPYNLYSLFFRTRGQHNHLIQLKKVLIRDLRSWFEFTWEGIQLREVFFSRLYGPPNPKMRFRRYPLTWPINIATGEKLRRYDSMLYCGPGLKYGENERGTYDPSGFFTVDLRWSFQLLFRSFFLYGVLHPLNWLGTPLVEFWLYFRYTFFKFWFPNLILGKTLQTWEKPISSWIFSGPYAAVPGRLFYFFCHFFVIIFFVYPYFIIFELHLHRFPIRFFPWLLNQLWQFLESFWLFFKRHLMGFYYGSSRTYDRVLNRYLKNIFDNASNNLFFSGGYLLPTLSFDDWLGLFKPRPWSYLDRFFGPKRKKSLFSLFTPSQFLQYLYVDPEAHSAYPPVWNTLQKRRDGYARDFFRSYDLYQAFRFTDPLSKPSILFPKLFYDLEVHDWNAYNWAKYHQLIMRTDVPTRLRSKYVETNEFDYTHGSHLRGVNAYWGNLTELYWHDGEYMLLFPKTESSPTVMDYEDELLITPFTDPIVISTVLLSQLCVAFFLFLSFPVRFSFSFIDVRLNRSPSKFLAYVFFHVWKIVSFPFYFFYWFFVIEELIDEAEDNYVMAKKAGMGEKLSRGFFHMRVEDVPFPVTDVGFRILYSFRIPYRVIKSVVTFCRTAIYITFMGGLVRYSGFGFFIIFFYIPWVLFVRIPFWFLLHTLDFLHTLVPIIFTSDPCVGPAEDWELFVGPRNLENFVFEFPDELEHFYEYDNTLASKVSGQSHVLRPSSLHYKGQSGVSKAIIEYELSKSVDELIDFAFIGDAEVHRSHNDYRTARGTYTDIERASSYFMDELADLFTGYEDPMEEHHLEDEDEIDEWEIQWYPFMDRTVEFRVDDGIGDSFDPDDGLTDDLPYESEDSGTTDEVAQFPVEVSTFYPFSYWRSTSSWGRVMDAAVYSYLTGSYSSYNSEMFRLRQSCYSAPPKQVAWLWSFSARVFRPLTWSHSTPPHSGFLANLLYWSKTFFFFSYNLILAWIAKPCWLLCCFFVRWFVLLLLSACSFFLFLSLSRYVFFRYDLQGIMLGDLVTVFPIWLFFFTTLWVFSSRFRFYLAGEFGSIVMFSSFWILAFLFFFVMDHSYPSVYLPKDYPFYPHNPFAFLNVNDELHKEYHAVPLIEDTAHSSRYVLNSKEPVFHPTAADQSSAAEAPRSAKSKKKEFPLYLLIPPKRVGRLRKVLPTLFYSVELETLDRLGHPRGLQIISYNFVFCFSWSFGGV